MVDPGRRPHRRVRSGGPSSHREAARRTAQSLATLASLWGPLPASGSICVVLPPDEKVRRVQGQVFHHDRNARFPVAGAGVTVCAAGRPGELVATAVTDQNGRFAFGRIPPGTYRIHARHGFALSMEAELVVACGSASAPETRDVVFELGSDEGDPRFGGSVRIVERSPDHS